jgi:ABC-type branched-subunit amino acid transport system ATPase component/branched-subunit amino acid ABC-type transport system permease component
LSGFFQFALLGLGSGSVYVLLALGIVLIFRGSGVINLAQGAYAMVAAYLYNDLHTTHSWPLWSAVLVSITAVMLLGVATDQLLLRRLRSASPLVRLMCTLGVLIVLQSTAVLIWGVNQSFVPHVIPSHPVDVLGVQTTSDRLWMLAIAVGLTGLLAVIWRATPIGWITEAVSENYRAAAAVGRSPELVSAGTWAAGTALAALAGILIAPITQLTQTNLTLTVIVALAAALIAGFRSFSLTLIAGLALGIAQSEIENYVSLTGAQDALPFAVIVIVMIVRGSALPLRGYVFDRFPAVGTGRIQLRLVLPAVAIAVVAALLLGSTWLSALTSTLAVGIILLSLVLLMGYAGQVSLAQYALAGIGALIAARLAAMHGFPFEAAIIVGALAAMVVGAVFALPAFRTRGMNLALVTLGLGVAVQSVIFNSASLTGGYNGIDVGSQQLFGWSVDPVAHPARYAMVVLTCFVLACLAVANIRRSRSGRQLLAVRGNERAAAALGINVFRAKLYAFAVAGALAGLGGILLSFQSEQVIFTGFDPVTSILATASAVIGGIGYVVGTLAGATLAPSSIGSLVAVNFQSIDEYLPLIGGVAVLVTLLQHPAGLADTVVRLWHRLVAPAPPTKVGITDAAPTRKVRPQTLAVDGVTVRYGAVTAVEGVSLEVNPGEVVGLIGPNGAGKTSLIDAIAGFTRASGTVRLGDAELQKWGPSRRAHAGLVRSFQGLELFLELTVLENVLAASERVGLGPMLSDPVRPGRLSLSPAASAALAEFDLLDQLDRLPDELPYGRRRLVAIARAVATEPSVLLLDEPAAGLSEHESAELAGLVRRLASSWGMGVLVIEHDMAFVMGMCDRVVVMDFGRKISEGKPAEVSTDPVALAAYLGEDTVPETAANADVTVSPEIGAG